MSWHEEREIMITLFNNGKQCLTKQIEWEFCYQMRILLKSH